MSAYYLQVGPGGICFAHGPYSDNQCPQFPACATDPQQQIYKDLAMPKPVLRTDTQVIISQLYILIGQLQTLLDRTPAD